MKKNIEKYYRVPEGYFSTVEDEILQKTVNSPRSNLSPFRRLRPWMSIAAGVVLLILSSIFYLSDKHDQDRDLAQTEEQTLVDVEDQLFAALIIESEEEEQTLRELAEFLTDLESLD